MAVNDKYRVLLESPLGRSRATLELVSNGAKLSGSLTGSMGVLTFADGALDGSKVRWTMKGLIAASYTNAAIWECSAVVESDAIRGEMTVGEVGTFAFHGPRMGPDYRIEDEPPALAWKDLGLPRYVPMSSEWVNALKEYVKDKTKGKTCDFELTWSIEYTDPPAHLLRGDGRDFVGYHFKAKDGKFEVCDEPLETADMRTRYPYFPVATHLYMNTDQYMAYVREHGAEFRDRVESIRTNVAIGKQVNEFMGGVGNDIREEFLSQRSLGGESAAESKE
jgi:hypothetical protein